MEAAEQLGAMVGLKSACTALGVNRAALYRHRTRQASRNVSMKMRHRFGQISVATQPPVDLNSR